MKTLLQPILTEILNILHTTVIKVGQTPVSLASILQLIISLIIIIIISRSLNNFLKNRLLVKFGIDEGNRDALATIITYIISCLGLLIILDSTGFNLSSLAVLAGGLGIGLGFGIQNITENFISGLTLLIERSIKVGDYVEIWVSEEFKTLKGTVKRISLRSTIIQTFEGANLILPNSSLVQKPILNWKYENNTYQITIPVKLDYGNDPLIITETLLNAAYMEPLVLKEPPPKIIFNGFVDGYLDFELRVWTNYIEKKTDIRSSLNFIIEYYLRYQGIYPPFAQGINSGITSSSKLQNSNDKSLQIPPLRILLRKVTYFQGFSDIELRQLIENGYRKRLRTDEILFRENDPGDAFYIVLSGLVEVYVEKINKHLTKLSSGQFLGELALMLAIPRTATVKALEDTTLFVINNHGFEKLLKTHPGLAEEIIQELGKHQEELASRQQQLRQMGLLDETEDDANLISWVRKRVQRVFSL